MRIEKLNNDKLKIMFNSQELEENNITVHSFLSGSNEAQKLFLAILDIADEEFGFDIKNYKISSETISFGNKDFVVFITRSLKNINSYEDINKFSPYNLLELIKSNHTQVSPLLSSVPPTNNTNKILYKFKNIEEVFEFCKYANSKLIQYFNNSLYKYNNLFFIVIDTNELTDIERKIVTTSLSEYKDSICLSSLAYAMFIEHSRLILENRAIQAL